MGSAAYTEGDQFQRERRALFANTWLLFAASGQLPAAGDFVSHSIGGWPLFAVRGEDGMARAFHNVCRHQSMPVIEQPAGHCEVLRCRYHGWAYGLAGEFREAPPRVASAEPPEHLGLNPVGLLERDGFCLVRIQPGREPPPSITEPGRFAGAVTTDIDTNWKAVVEPLLGAEGRHFVWPLAFIDRSEPGLTLVRQIVPRSFLRTRIVDLLFTADGAASDDLMAGQQQRAAADKTAAERCHAARAGGNAAPLSGATAAFLDRVAAACAE
jgi:nitrite reductase/ring-hydroxylating ferredoxin subunit